MVRTRMVVSEIHRHRGVKRHPETGAYQPHEVHTVTLHACDGEPLNDHVRSATSPFGRLELAVSDQEMPDFFEVGKAYFLDLSPAE